MALRLNSTGGGSVTLDAPSTPNTYTVTLPATNQTLGLTSGTAVTASGTSVDFTDIPSWVKRITVMLNGVSMNGTGILILRIGSGTLTTSGYSGFTNTFNVSPGGTAYTTSFLITEASAAASTVSVHALLTNISGNSWVFSVNGGDSTGGVTVGGGNVTISGVLDRVRITTVNGTDTFDAGTINIMYEG